MPEGPFLDKLFLQKEPDFTPCSAPKTIYLEDRQSILHFVDSSYRNKLIDELTYQTTIRSIRIVFDAGSCTVGFKWLAEEYEIHIQCQISPMIKRLSWELDKSGYTK